MKKKHNKKNNGADRTGTTTGRKLTGRLEMRLPADAENMLLDLLENNTRTKTDMVISLLKNKRLYYHLTEKEQEIYLTLSELRVGFIRIKSALKGMSEKDRLKFFNDNPDFMANWIALVDQCIEQWGRIIEHLSE